MADLQAKLLSQQLADQHDSSIRARALATLIDNAAEPLRRYVMTHAPLEYVEDICADTWEIMIKHVQAVKYEDRGEDAIGYLFGIAHNVWLRYGTRQQREQQHEVMIDEINEPVTEDAVMESERRLDLASLGRMLTEPEDRAVLQALQAEQTIADMAQAWDCHYKTAWRRYHKFLEHSRALLDNGPTVE